MTPARRLASAITLLLVTSAIARAQDTLSLAELQRRAMARDARERQVGLLANQSRLRIQAIAAEKRPAFTVESQAQYQSAVARLPVSLPGGLTVPTPPHATYDARIVAQQRIYDATLGPRLAVENAQLAASTAQVRTGLHSLRQNVADAFFAAVRARAQLAEAQTGITDLEAQLLVATARVREGAALPSEDYSIRAELLRRREIVAELEAGRRAAVAVLTDLTGQPIDSAIAFAEPSLADAVATVRAGLDMVRARPEFDQFTRVRDLLREQSLARAAMDKPRVSLFGRVGYGRPGLNPLNTGFEPYWLTGVQLQWSPWTWGASQRDREGLELQRQMVTADEEAFAAALRRAVLQDLSTIDRLEASLSTDDQIIDLRERVLAETRARFAESVVTSAEYVDRQTDVLSARLTRAIHRVELAQARARILTILGLEVR